MKIGFADHLELRHSVRIHREMVLASAVSPAIDTPTWSSIGRIFFWWLQGMNCRRG
jgi:hypothetical protein